MTQGLVQIAVFLVVLTALTPLLGAYIARVFQGERVFLSPVIGPIERFSYTVLRVRPDGDQDWKEYAKSTIVFSLLSWLMLYLILRTQSIQPLNPEGFHSAPWNLTFNATSSFVTNTNWQYYGGETTLTYFAQMAGLAVQNFVSAAVGIAVLAAVIRGFAARSARSLGNFWVDLIRICVLHPAADLVRRCPRPRLPGRDPDSRRRRRPSTRSSAALRPWPSGRSPRRRRSRSSGPTAAASSTSTAAYPFENSNGLTGLPRAAADPDHPCRPHLHLRADDRQPAPGLGALHRDDVDVRRRRQRRLRRRAARLARAAPRRGRDPGLPRLDGRQHGGQGAAFRDRRLLALDGGHHRHLLRRGQRRLRLADRDRRTRPDREPLAPAR